MEKASGETVVFFTEDSKESENRQILQMVYEALSEKGYNPVNQIVGYLLSEDPTYITNYKNARSLICKIDRDETLAQMLRQFLHIV